MNFVSNLINGVSNIGTYVTNIINAIGGIYQGVDFTDLFVSIFPNDIALVCAAVITVILFISLISLAKKIILFLGG